nr:MULTISPECIES: CHAD domain-containing protein [Pseudomonas]
MPCITPAVCWSARTDSEALHDLRIAVRRIRSLLRPMRALSEVAALNFAAAGVGRLTRRLAIWR